MDSWFVKDTVIKGIRAIKDGAMIVLGMCRKDNRNYLLNGKELNVKQLIIKFGKKKGKCSKKYKSQNNQENKHDHDIATA